jgi:uncharacterized protein YciI
MITPASVISELPESRIILCLALLFSATLFTQSSIAEEGTNYFLIRYLPGENWNSEISYEDQPGLKQHHLYLREQQTHGPLLIAGPLGGEPGALALVRTGSLEEAEAIARQDPGVKTQIVKAAVTAWDIQMSSMRFDKREPMPPLDDPEQPFRLKRIDPESRINIEN